MTDLNTEGAFTWESGHRLTSDVSAHWYPGEPNNSDNEDCATVGHIDGRMNDLKCDEKVKFVCQKRGDVNCGRHHATSCSNCANGPNGLVGEAWCKGDCSWVNNACHPKGYKPPPPPPPKVTITGKCRSDGRCGPSYPLDDGTPSQCNPNADNSCCSPSGWCGSSSAHCECAGCRDYSQCPNGYSFKRGDVPGNTISHTPGITNADKCSALCNNNPSCNSFEYSRSSQHCNLNKESEPTTGPFQDEQFCSKDHNGMCWCKGIIICIHAPHFLSFVV